MQISKKRGKLNFKRRLCKGELESNSARLLYLLLSLSLVG